LATQAIADTLARKSATAHHRTPRPLADGGHLVPSTEGKITEVHRVAGAAERTMMFR